MFRIVKTCKQIFLVCLTLNAAVSDQGLVNSIFAHCPHLNQLTLEGCCRIRGHFLAHLPLTLKYLYWRLYDAVSSSFSLLQIYMARNNISFNIHIIHIMYIIRKQFDYLLVFLNEIILKLAKCIFILKKTRSHMLAIFQ